MLYVVPFIASALMFLFIFCAVRAIRDYSGSWVVFSCLLYTSPSPRDA